MFIDYTARYILCISCEELGAVTNEIDEFIVLLWKLIMVVVLSLICTISGQTTLCSKPISLAYNISNGLTILECMKHSTAH